MLEGASLDESSLELEAFKRASKKQSRKHMMMCRNVGGQRVRYLSQESRVNTEGMPSGALWEMRDNK